MEKEFDIKEVVYYGIPLTFESNVYVMQQAYFSKVLFFHPFISTQKAHAMLTRNYRLFTLRKHALRWRKQIKGIVAGYDTTGEIVELIQQVAIKIVKWGRQFTWPFGGEILELAEYLDISWDILITGMYDYFIKSNLTKQEILDFLNFYEGCLFSWEVDELLGKLSQLKQLAAMEHKLRPGQLTAKRLLQSPLQRG